MPKNNDLPKPVTYSQQFYAKAAGMDVDLPEDITPEQKYLKAIAERGKSIGNIGDVEIDNPENGEVIKYDAEQGKWINGTASGGGGTSDYTDLTNKPKINGVTLAGSKSLEDIGAAAASETYTDTEVDALLAAKADADDVYTKAQTDTELAKKVDKETGKGLSTNDFTNADKANLATAIEKANAAAPQATTYTKGQVDAALAAKLNTADVDAALSSTSTNPVQNKMIQAPIARFVDAGEKNILDFANLSKAGGTAVVDKDNDSITAGSTAEYGSWINVAYTLPILKPGSYTFSALISAYSISGGAARIIITKAIGGQQEVNGITLTANGKIKFNFASNGEQLYLLYYPNYSSSGQTNSFKASQNMICTAEDYAISTEFVPYAPSNRELYEEKISLDDAFGLGTAITESANLNELTSIGSYYTPSSSIAATLINAPSGLQVPSMIRLEVKNTNGTNRYMQILYSFDIGSGKTSIYIRQYTANGWLPWYKFEGTAVT